MTYLDPPAAAARRQNVLDRWVELLVGYGCPLDSAPNRAQRMLDVALDHGYALPVALEGAPLHGHGSTLEGRARARRIALHTLGGCRCQPDAARALPPAEHPDTCPVRTAHDAATEQGQNRHQPAASELDPRPEGQGTRDPIPSQVTEP